jgi:hypothetical protein
LFYPCKKLIKKSKNKFMKKSLIIIILAAVFSIGKTTAQTLDVNFTGTCNSYISLTETQDLAQTFTPGVSGSLTKVTVGVSVSACTYTSVMTGVANIYIGDCSGTLLTTEPFTFTTGTPLSMREIILTSQPNIIAGNTYSIQLITDAGQDCNDDTWGGGPIQSVSGAWHLENIWNCGGSYAGGTAYDPGCIPYPGDYYIQTYVTVPPCITDQTVTTTNTSLCIPNSGTTITTGSSEVGINYYLRNNSDNSVIDGPITGSGSSISLNTGSLTTNTTYNVYAEKSDLIPVGALEFTGNSGLKRVNLGTNLWDNNFVGTNNLTVEAWVKRSSTGSLHTIIGNYDASWPILFRIDSDHIILGVNTAASIQGTTAIPVGIWTHVAGTYDGTTLKVFVNGLLDGQTTFGGSFITTTRELRIGGGLNNNTEYFPGDIADVRMWNITKTEAEITASMNTTLTGTESGLIANYQFTEGTGTTTANSATGNAYPGSFTNSPAWVTGPILTSITCTLEISDTPAVTINQPTTGAQTLVECTGFAVTVGANTYNTTGIYTDVITNAAGCDSTVTTNLTINQPTTGAQTLVECAGFSVTVGANTYNTTGIYTDVLTNAAGCDSTVTTNLTINQPTTSTQTLIECTGFTVTVGANAYNTTGIYTDVLTNAAGCDSTVTTNLTINQSTTSTQTLVECDGYSITVGTSSYNTTGVYTDVLTNAAGCDSTVTTDLTINQPTASSQTLEECDGFSITVGTNTYTTTGVYTDVFTNTVGCDSIVTTNLTVYAAIDTTVDNTSLPTLTANQIGATYQWIDCDNGNAPIAAATNQSYTATENGNYAVEITVGSCMETSACHNVENIGVNEIENNSILIYPNPTNDFITVNITNIVGTVNYSLTSIDGRLIEQKQNVTTNSMHIDLSNESKGIYLLKIGNNTSSNVYRVVKQ